MLNQMDASVVGIGQLITQRKRLRIPPHQREFSWTREVVQEFVKDVLQAADTGAPYFIGMVVLQGPSDAWTVLDGQQRLITVSLIYSCIASWLESAGKSEDAKQLRDDYLQVRQLGGKTGPRLRVSDDLAETYNSLVVTNPNRAGVASEQATAIEPGSAEQKLVEAVATINRSIIGWIEKEADTAGRAYRLATMLERDVTVAALDVRDERSAFVIFETLNDRGVTLTAWDLVRNHVLKECGSSNYARVKEYWRNILSHVPERDADDFLKVSWTACFGRVQRGDLFDRIRERFKGETGAIELVTQLSTTSEIYAAITRPDHPYWSRYQTVRNLIGVLDVLGNRQLRPAIVSAVLKFQGPILLEVLAFFVDLLVRYQVVGRRRTGALEIGAARIAKKIYAGEIKNRPGSEDELAPLWVDDGEFLSDLSRFRDTKEQRLLYMAAALESNCRTIPLDLLRVPIATASSTDLTLEGDFQIDAHDNSLAMSDETQQLVAALTSKPLLALVREKRQRATSVRGKFS